MKFVTHITLLSKASRNVLCDELMYKGYTVSNCLINGGMYAGHFADGSLCEMLVMLLEHKLKSSCRDVCHDIQTVSTEKNVEVCSIVVTREGSESWCNAGNLKPRQVPDVPDIEAGPYRSTGKFAEG